MKQVTIIGAGFSGLAAACTLAQAGFDVKVIEKNKMAGGRAQFFKSDGFTFDMGPSWYWMPEVFDDFFEAFGKRRSDYYELTRLDPSYQVIFENNQIVKIPASLNELYELFESHEEGAGKKLKVFLDEAKYKYEVGMKEFVWKPSLSIKEFMDIRIFKSALKLKMFSSIRKEVRRLFKNPYLIQILEFPVLFLGATPQNTPALYSLMNYADLALGTWYPKGGMFQIPKAMYNLALELGVEFKFNESVEKIQVEKGQANLIITNKGSYETDVVLSSGDYQHADRKLLEPENSNYSEAYWNKRTMAPSSLLFYLGIDKKIERLKHHNLFFDEDFELHAHEIYEDPKWPSRPLFYVCCPSKTDVDVAPEGMENVFLLMPIAVDIKDDDKTHEKYYDIMMSRLEASTGVSIRDHVVYKRSFGVKDFVSEYNSFKGNAYGLANTLSQTAILKPSIKNKRVANMYYAGQLSTPGPGVPPSIISGQVVAKKIIKTYL